MTQNETEIEEIDPGADWCPWCRSVRRWKGRHAAAKHPEEWDAFKSYFVKKNSRRVAWETP